MRTNPDTSADTLPTLGSPIKPAAKPTAAPVPVSPGIVRNADGTLATNATPPAPVWVYTPPAAAPTAMPVISDGQAEDWEGLCASPTFTGTYMPPGSRTAEEAKGDAEAAEFLKNLPEYGGLL